MIEALTAPAFDDPRVEALRGRLVAVLFRLTVSDHVGGEELVRLRAEWRCVRDELDLLAADE